MNITNILIIFSAKYLFIVILIVAAIVFLKLEKAKQKELFIFALFTLPAAFITVKLASFLYYNPRPFVVGDFIPLIPHTKNNGFPSDHTILSATVAALIFPYAKKTGLILWLLAFAVGIARMAAGVHHFVDILGSLIIALIISSLIFYFILPRIIKKINKFY